MTPAWGPSEFGFVPLGRGAFVRPTTLDAVLDRLAAGAAAGRRPHLLAGATDWAVDRHLGHRPTDDDTEVVDLTGVPELRGLGTTPSGDGLRIGACCTYRDLRRSAVAERLPLLAAMAAEVGAIAIQSRGTLGGNLGTASPAADAPPVLLAYGASIELRGPRGVRRVPANRFFLSYRRVDMGLDELITAVEVPFPTSNTVQFYRKVGTRMAQSIAKVSLAAVARRVEDRIVEPRMAMASVAPVPVRLTAVERVVSDHPVGDLKGRSWRARVREALTMDIAPIDDVRSTAAYRGTVAGNLLERFLDKLADAEEARPSRPPPTR